MKRKHKDILKSVLGVLLPLGIRNLVRQTHRNLVLKFHLNRVINNPEFYLTKDCDKADKRLNRLIYAWGNQDWSVDSAYLKVCGTNALNSKGPILECGSGITSLFMSAVCLSTNNQIYSLEHESDWVIRVSESAAKFGLYNCKVIHSPLCDYEDYQWYDKSVIPDLDFSLFVCDGPPGAVKGGRYGLLPAIQEKLSVNSIILLDDCQRDKELDIVSQWAQEFDLDYTIHGTNKRFAIVKASTR